MLEELKNLSSIIEILFLFLVFYLLLTFLKNTRGQAILNGIVIFFVITFVFMLSLTEWIGLIHLKQFLQLLLSISLVACLVIFAPEIRQGLGSLTLHPIFSNMLKPANTVMEEIANAIEYFSKNKIGALIALEGKVSLKEYINKSHKIDADVSTNLLRSIFMTTSPLHDGAVIISSNRIACASAILPLSDNSEKLRNVGTRHRAGLGLTEETDAITIIVSEERGSIHLCFNRELKEIDVATLRDILKELFKSPQQHYLFERIFQSVDKIRKITSRIQK